VKITRQQIITWLFVATMLIMAWFLRSVIAYFVVAMILAFIGAPIIAWQNRVLRYKGKPLPTWIPASAILLLFIGLFAAFVFMVVPPLVDQTAAISNISQHAFDKSFGQPMHDIRYHLENIGVPAEDLTPTAIQSKLKEYLSFATLSNIAGSVFSSLTATVGWVFSVLFISFFFLKDKYLVYRLLYILTPDKYEPRMQRVIRGLNDMLGRYFRSIFIQVFVFGSYIYVGLTLAGEKFALTVAIFSGLINLVSYIGPIIGISFALIFCILSNIGADFYTVIVGKMYEVVVVYAIAIVLDNFVSYPIIFSKSLKVHPMELFFVILAGAQLGGLGGMMIAAPLYTVLRIIAKEFLGQFEIVQSVTKHL